MLSMLKLLATTLLLSSAVYATSTTQTVENFLEKSFKNNPNISSLKVTATDEIDIEKLEDWSAVIINVDAVVKANGQNRNVKQKMIWFTNGEVITKDLIDLETGKSFTDIVSPTFKPEYYKAENLIYGNANAKHKVAIFSDPLCPFCKSFVPEAIEEMKKEPTKFAIYYYNFPLESLHPASVTLVKAAIAAELKGQKDVTLNLYKIEIDLREKNVTKILEVFNKAMKTDLSESDINAPSVVKYYKDGLDLADELMVQGTPTVFFDGELDRSKKEYQKVK